MSNECFGGFNTHSVHSSCQNTVQQPTRCWKASVKRLAPLSRNAEASVLAQVITLVHACTALKASTPYSPLSLAATLAMYRSIYCVPSTSPLLHHVTVSCCSHTLCCLQQHATCKTVHLSGSDSTGWLPLANFGLAFAASSTPARSAAATTDSGAAPSQYASCSMLTLPARALGQAVNAQSQAGNALFCTCLQGGRQRQTRRRNLQLG